MEKKLRITVGCHSGFCFGVKRAYEMTLKCAKNCRKPVCVLGKLVHNEDVVKKLRELGIEAVNSLDNIPKGTVIFTAHGTEPSLHRRAKSKGLTILDTICPNVLRAQKLAQDYSKKNYQVIIFGDKNHKEVKSVYKWADKKPKIIENFGDLKKLKLEKNKKYCLISQTTQNLEQFKKIADYLKKKNLEKFVFFNTICRSTHDRQNEIRKLARINEIVIVIGGKDSANSCRLYEIAKEINPKSYFIENSKELKKSWFRNICEVAVGAGASTPEWVIEEVVKSIRDFTPNTCY